ncbi:putative acyltransferase [Dysgonomonas alginatilytica]|uniref:Putative acyltransferase n=1 Tax=Dysgonomonas alginatilytica TaxID=1605892 RepID=A0A2V3PNN7_9BACT|nr:DUF5009 domain-containing protein [Dysgonomonas alginatilytica]PXV63558.1 putative acyltransferase [Dysgonomonas alginatilytica]
MEEVIKIETKSERLASIDILRGFDMFFLVGAGDILRRLFGSINSDMVNPIMYQLEHADWVGFTAWDIIMPLFLFTSGLSMPLSFEKQINNGLTKSELHIKVIKRFCKLFFLGWIVQGNLLDLDLGSFHVYSNTLQAIAAGYLITSLVVLNTKKLSTRLLWGSGLLILYWLLLMFVPVPGYGSGILTPEGNLAMYVDNLLLGGFRDGTQYTWVLSSLGFGATVLSGYYAGYIMKQYPDPKQKLMKLLLFGAALIIAGMLLSLQMPIIKKIWSPSLVLFSSGICFILLAFFYWITDMRKIDCWWTKAFRYLGLNAIAAYLLYTTMGLDLISEHLLRGLQQYSTDLFPFFISLGQFAILFLIIKFMYKHKIFLKV